MIRALLALVLLIASPLSFASERAEQAWQLIKQQDAVIIDVRSPGEFAGGRLKGAINLPHDSIGEAISHLYLDKTQPIVLYCRSGRRSGIALDTLTQKGFTNVVNGGGIEEMLEAQR
ncbi:rhodanese-like domain-containing protein [Ferrimonas aestuarii]|uniref:Rhodanese-like domain-containing protein n=1 Tax=Ferrimonas aestuarii TaxID=2569539 RepID=A0A4U1BTB8_9GAMM|nr:rhodanese-like domain-containing protein [Ferrimonas aestuarii]TKB55525.1 rhodanese-like domain-containing protein [Ferrimonas aestuarii]